MKNKKNVLAVLLTMALAIGITGCGDDHDHDHDVPAPVVDNTPAIVEDDDIAEDSPIEGVDTDIDISDAGIDISDAGIDISDAGIDISDPNADATTTSETMATASGTFDVPFALMNSIGFDLVDFYMAQADTDNWSEDFLNETIAVSNGLTCRVAFNADIPLWDIKLIGTDGTEVILEDVDFSEQSVDGIRMVVMNLDGENYTYTFM